MYCGVGRRLGGWPVLRGGPIHPIAIIIYDVTIYIYIHSHMLLYTVARSIAVARRRSAVIYSLRTAGSVTG
jgi:hypothetical protein